MPEALPTSADDPRLDGWYHTIELGEGIGSRGYYDHRGVDRFGLAPSLEGRTALDVGTGDGFLAFENSYWPFTTRALQDMLLYADFTTAEVQGSFELPPHRLPVTAVIGRV